MTVPCGLLCFAAPVDQVAQTKEENEINMVIVIVGDEEVRLHHGADQKTYSQHGNDFLTQGIALSPEDKPDVPYCNAGENQHKQ